MGGAGFRALSEPPINASGLPKTGSVDVIVGLMVAALGRHRHEVTVFAPHGARCRLACFQYSSTTEIR